MRIGIDARMFGNQVTGIGIYVKNLILNLAEIDDANQYFIFLNDLGLNDELSLPKNFFKVKADFKWYTLAEQLKFNKLLKRHNLDVMHFPNFNIPIFYPGNFLVTIHDLTPKFFPGPKVSRSIFRKLAYDLVLYQAINKSKKILTVSNQTKADILKYFQVSADKIIVAYLGIDKQFSKIENYVIIKSLMDKYRIDKPYIFYTGVWRTHKNLPNLLKAFKILLEKYKLDIKLVLGGDKKNQDPAINETIKLLNIGDRIIDAGFIPNDELPIFYSAAKATVIPSYREGFGLLALESLSCGTPIVASQTTAVPEILEAAGKYFPPDEPEKIAQAIHEVLTDESVKKELLGNFEKVKNKFSWRNCAKITLKAYEDLCPVVVPPFCNN